MSVAMQVASMVIVTLIAAGLLAEYLCKRADTRGRMPWRGDEPAPSNKFENRTDKSN